LRQVSCIFNFQINKKLIFITMMIHCSCFDERRFALVKYLFFRLFEESLSDKYLRYILFSLSQTITKIQNFKINFVRIKN